MGGVEFINFPKKKNVGSLLRQPTRSMGHMGQWTCPPPRQRGRVREGQRPHTPQPRAGRRGIGKVAASLPHACAVPAEWGAPLATTPTTSSTSSSTMAATARRSGRAGGRFPTTLSGGGRDHGARGRAVRARRARRRDRAATAAAARTPPPRRRGG